MSEVQNPFQLDMSPRLFEWSKYWIKSNRLKQNRVMRVTPCRQDSNTSVIDLIDHTFESKSDQKLILFYAEGKKVEKGALDMITFSDFEIKCEYNYQFLYLRQSDSTQIGTKEINLLTSPTTIRLILTSRLTIFNAYQVITWETVWPKLTLKSLFLICNVTSWPNNDL